MEHFLFFLLSVAVVISAYAWNHSQRARRFREDREHARALKRMTRAIRGYKR